MTTSMTATSAESARVPNRWRALAVICLCVTVVILDNTILNVALPSIQRSLHASGAQLQWVVDAYTLTFAALLLIAGNLGDKYGRRGALLVGLVIFGTGSALAAFATSATALIAFRGLMGIGGAAIFPTTLSIITNTFEGDERGRAIGIWSALSGVGIAAGPIVGGFLLDHYWWGSVLLVNIPIVAASIVLVVLYVPTSKAEHAPPLDIPGAVLATAGMTALVYGIIEAPHAGWTSTKVVVALTLGVVVLVAFVLREHSTDHPMLPVTVLCRQTFQRRVRGTRPDVLRSVRLHLFVDPVPAIRSRTGSARGGPAPRRTRDRHHRERAARTTDLGAHRDKGGRRRRPCSGRRGHGAALPHLDPRR